jgi:hypothetical protein
MMQFILKVHIRGNNINKVIFDWYKDLMKVQMQDLCGPFIWVAIHMPFSFQFWNPKNLIFSLCHFFPWIQTKCPLFILVLGMLNMVFII